MIDKNDLENEDKGLVSFLKNNAPDIPKASDGLEDSIMRTISAKETSPRKESGLLGRLQQLLNPYIFVPTAITVAALIISLIIFPINREVKIDSVEFAETGDFVEYVWERSYEDYLDDSLTNEINEIMEL